MYFSKELGTCFELENTLGKLRKGRSHVTCSKAQKSHFGPVVKIYENAIPGIPHTEAFVPYAVYESFSSV